MHVCSLCGLLTRLAPAVPAVPAAPQNHPDELAGLTLGPLIGAGAHGKVYRGIWRGRKVAVKASGAGGARGEKTSSRRLVCLLQQARQLFMTDSVCHLLCFFHAVARS